MKNLKIGKKLFITFGIIVAMFAITVILSITSLVKNGTSLNDFYENGYAVTSYVKDLQTTLQRSAKNVGYAIMSPDINQTTKYVQDAKTDFAALSDGINAIESKFTVDHAVVAIVKDAIAKIGDTMNQVCGLAAAMRNEEAAALYFEKVYTPLGEAQAQMQILNENASKHADSGYADSKAAERSTIILVCAISLVALIVTIFLAIYITNGLKRPILEIEHAASEMAKGHLDVSVDYQSKDELGNLAGIIRNLTDTIKAIISDEDYLLDEMGRGNFDIISKAEDRYVGDFRSILDSIHHINTNLSDTLSQINRASDQVSSGSDQVSSGAQALSQGATEQASSVQELAATITEISTQVKQNAEKARNASSKVNSVGGQLTQSNQSMQDMIKAMDEISDSSRQIGKIIKTIEDIAFQTNILALNAAVEAARAGAAGKGFAVVADEVRNLANKSQEASKNTSVLIASSLKAVEGGSRIAGETATSLLAVVEGTKEITAGIDQIAEASNQQAQSIVQVTQGVDQISAVVQTNSATAEESAAASEELSGQAAMLKNLVGRFRLRNHDSSDPVTPAPETHQPKMDEYSSPMGHTSSGKY